MFTHFPQFDETLHHIELCNSVISQIYREIRLNFSNSVYVTLVKFICKQL